MAVDSNPGPACELVGMASPGVGSALMGGCLAWPGVGVGCLVEVAMNFKTCVAV